MSAHTSISTDPAEKAAYGERTFGIAQLAAEFGVTTRAIRFYEDKGLLSPRRVGLQRVYAPRDRARLKLILQGKRVGFALSEIKEMLDLYDVKDGQEAQMRVGLERFRRRIEDLRRQKDDIDAQLEQLEEGCDLLEDMLRDARGKGGEPTQTVSTGTAAPGKPAAQHRS